MLVRSQKGPGRIIVVNTDQVNAWEINTAGTLFAYTSTDCFSMGRFANQDAALRFLGRMQLHANGGNSVMGVPDREEKNED